MYSKYTRVERAIGAAKASVKNPGALSKIEDIDLCEKYSEPGYMDPDCLIAVGDWNDFSQYNERTRKREALDNTMSRLVKVLEKMGCDIQWCDEWTNCNECMGLVRIIANGWGWTPSYTILEDSIVCLNCIEADCSLAEAALREKEGNFESATTIDPEPYGYVLIDSFASGFHGRRDNPEHIGKLMDGAGFERYLFKLEPGGQFESHFTLWLHEDEASANNGDGLILAKRTIERGM